jgi:hypothetical protein
VYLLPGEYDYGLYQQSLLTTTVDRWVTLTAAPGIDRSAVVLVSESSSGLRTKLVHLKEMTIRTSLGSGGGEDYLWIDHCDMIGYGAQTSIAPGSWYSTTVWTRVMVTDTLVTQDRNGPIFAYLARGNVVKDIGSDAFRNSVTVINCLVDGIDVGDTEYHPDVIQFNGVAGEIKDNYIFYGIRAINVISQCIFARNQSEVNNTAFVNICMEKITESSHLSQWRVENSNHLLFWGVTLYGQTMQFREGVLDNLSVRGCVFTKLTRDTTELDDSSFESNHYMDVSSWAALSPGSDVTTGEPGFVDPVGHDYHPAEGSPLLGRVINPVAAVDLAGSPRISPSSVGAYE